jgi:16S rRNA (uracil1498-N3)-methyltransferase
MHRFYCPDLSVDEVLFPEEEAHHCAKVLRAAVGDQVVLMDGKGQVAFASLSFISKKQVKALVQSREVRQRQAVQLHLAMAPPKSRDRLEWLVEKAVECGLTILSFLFTDRSERVKINIDRLEKIAISAMKQSGNPWLCHIRMVNDFKSFLSEASGLDQQRWMAHVAPHHPHFFQAIQPGEDGLLLIGPEGDFSEEECSLAVKYGFQLVSLGSLVLRTETAGLFGVNAFYIRQLNI